MRAQAAIQAQLALHASRPRSGPNLALIDCLRLACRTASVDCVLDKARICMRF